MPSWLPPALVALVVGVLVLALDVGRRHQDGSGREDTHWFAGVIYVNRWDKRILVPKRYGLGLGHTLNFAHPVSWAIMLVPLALAAVSALARHH